MDENRAPEQDDQDRREAEERAEKMERGKETLTDIFTVVPAIMAERRREILEKYGLHNPVDASPDEELRNMILGGAMTSEQKEMYRRALSAYGKRKLPTCGLLE